MPHKPVTSSTKRKASVRLSMAYRASGTIGDQIGTQNDAESSSRRTQLGTQSTAASITFNRWAPRVDNCASLVDLDELLAACSSEWHNLTIVDGTNAPTCQPRPNVLGDRSPPQTKEPDAPAAAGLSRFKKRQTSDPGREDPVTIHAISMASS